MYVGKREHICNVNPLQVRMRLEGSYETKALSQNCFDNKQIR